MKQAKSIRFLCVGFVGMLVALGLGYYLWPRARSNGLNVVLVTLDTTRADRMGCYGYGKGRTPALDALAESGVLFEMARTTYPMTLPAHTSMLTGLYPPEHGLRINNRGRLGSSVPVLAEILRGANYDTAAFLASVVLDSDFGLDRGFQTYDDEIIGKDPERPETGVREGRVVMDRALQWLKGRGSRNFFCWIHLYDAHSPYDVRRETFGRQFEDQPYDAGIACADLELKRLIDELKSRQLDSKTLVVVVGDHGECLMEHNEATHAFQLYDTTLHVPLVFAGPPFVKPGHRVATGVSVVDLMPTILDCLEIPLPAPVSGRSVKEALSGLEIESRPAYAETECGFLSARCAPLRSVIANRWKFVETTRPELYDLTNDPHERRNLFASESEHADELQKLLEEMQSKMTPREAAAVNLTPNQIRLLESLGYAASGKASSSPVTTAERLSDVKDLLPQFIVVDKLKRLQRPSGAVLTEAITTLSQVLEQFPQFNVARNLLAKALFDAGRLEDADRQCAILIEDEPSTAANWFLWGNTLAALGRFDEAIPRYRQALDLQPNSTAFHYYLGLVLLKVGQPAEAMTEFEEAIRCDETFADAHFQLARLEEMGGMAQDARKHSEAALRLEPKHPGAADLLQRLKASSGK